MHDGSSIAASRIFRLGHGGGSSSDRKLRHRRRRRRVQLSVDPHCRRRRRRSRATVVILSFTLRREWPMAEAFAFCLRETSCFFHDESRPFLMGRENRFYVGISTLLRRGLHADPVGPKVRLSSCDKEYYGDMEAGMEGQGA